MIARAPTTWLITIKFIAAGFIFSATSLAQSNDGPKASASKAPDATAEPTSAEVAGRIDRLIEQLGDSRFPLREQAHHELAEIGAAAFDALTAAQGHQDPEVAHRARSLVQSIRMEWVRDSDSEEIRKLLSDYDSLPDQERRKRIALLAAKPQSEALAPLCRVVRFERSVLLSKEAALAVMDQKRPAGPEWSERSRIILAETNASRRPSVVWLRVYAEFPARPDESLAAWEDFLKTEGDDGKKLASHQGRTILAGLLRQQVIMLLEVKCQDEALVVLRRMLDMESGDSEPLAQLIEWVIRQEAWPLIDEVAQRLDRKLTGDPYLMYLIAQAYDLRGDSERAEAMAAKALAQQAATNVDHHFRMGYLLQQQGLAKWAEREYRAVIGSTAEGTFTELAFGMLAELLNDHQRFGEAADVLEQHVKKMGEQPRRQRAQRAFNRSGDQVRARLHYFRSKQFAVEKNSAKQVEHLNKALTYDPTEADVLIALYRVEDQSPADRERVRARIKQAANLFKQRVNSSPEDTTAMNQYAWLVGNTEGDYAEATRLSQRSVELANPEQLGGYLDTLAHCYAAEKDYESALKHQSRAAELEPHSQEIKRAYERFKKLAGEQTAADKDAGKEPAPSRTDQADSKG
jgi:tetratricopeptide (TPR) repeat protein